MKDEAIDAMNALFDFAEAMNKGVSIADLHEAMEAAIAEGHDMLGIVLAMAQQALRLTRRSEVVA